MCTKNREKECLPLEKGLATCLLKSTRRGLENFPILANINISDTLVFRLELTYSGGRCFLGEGLLPIASRH